MKFAICALVLLIALSACATPIAQPTKTLSPKPTAPNTPKPTQTPKPSQTPDGTGTRMWELSFAQTLTAEPSPTFPKDCGRITLGSLGTQSQDKRHPVLAQGIALLCNQVYRDADGAFLISTPIPEAWLDLDTGSSGTESTADLWLYRGGGSDLFYYLFDLDNARVVGLWGDDEPTFDECKDIDKLDNSENAPWYACVITNAGHVARIKVEEYEPFRNVSSMKISFITWDVLVPTITPTP